MPAYKTLGRVLEARFVVGDLQADIESWSGRRCPVGRYVVKIGPAYIVLRPWLFHLLFKEAK